jgi:hypothetical protein
VTKKQFQENSKEKKDKNDTSFNCYKCAKIYRTKKHLIEHEKKCNGLSILTCPKCMKTFSNNCNKNQPILKRIIVKQEVLFML